MAQLSKVAPRTATADACVLRGQHKEEPCLVRKCSSGVKATRATVDVAPTDYADYEVSHLKSSISQATLRLASESTLTPCVCPFLFSTMKGPTETLVTEPLRSRAETVIPRENVVKCIKVADKGRDAQMDSAHVPQVAVAPWVFLGSSLDEVFTPPNE